MENPTVLLGAKVSVYRQIIYLAYCNNTDHIMVVCVSVELVHISIVHVHIFLSP